MDGHDSSGGGGTGEGKHKGIEKKEIAVWKFPEELDESAVCNWVDAVDMQLEVWCTTSSTRAWS